MKQELKLQIIETLKQGFSKQLEDIEEYLSIVEKLELTNEQFVLDYLDKLNEFSVKY